MYRYTRRYTGPIQAVILDLAGTCVDFGSLAPIHAFLELFKSEGLDLSEADDTTTGIEEGLNAGMWTVAVVASGNSVGLSEEALGALSDNERAHRLAEGDQTMAQSGAHYVIDSIKQLPKVLAEINAQLAAGQCP